MSMSHVLDLLTHFRAMATAHVDEPPPPSLLIPVDHSERPLPPPPPPAPRPKPLPTRPKAPSTGWVNFSRPGHQPCSDDESSSGDELSSDDDGQGVVTLADSSALAETLSFPDGPFDAVNGYHSFLGIDGGYLNVVQHETLWKTAHPPQSGSHRDSYDLYVYCQNQRREAGWIPLEVLNGPIKDEPLGEWYHYPAHFRQSH